MTRRRDRSGAGDRPPAGPDFCAQGCPSRLFGMPGNGVCRHPADSGIMVAMTVTTPASPTRVVRFDIPQHPEDAAGPVRAATGEGEAAGEQGMNVAGARATDELDP